MAKKLDFTGQKIGSLTVIKEAPSETKTTYWQCRCVCGKNITFTTRKLNSGTVKDCGFCKRKRKPKSKFIK